jgi:hypothetical protein
MGLGKELLGNVPKAVFVLVLIKMYNGPRSSTQKDNLDLDFVLETRHCIVVESQIKVSVKLSVILQNHECCG